MSNYQFNINQKSVEIQILNLTTSEATVVVNNKKYEIDIEGMPGMDAVSLAGQVGLSETPVACQEPTLNTVKPEIVKASMPGKLLAVFVEVGGVVQTDQPLFKMESMKMEYEVCSPCEGTIIAVNVQADDPLRQNQELITIAPVVKT